VSPGHAIAGIDLGATNLRAVVSLSGSEAGRVERRTPDRDAETVESAISDALGAAAEAAGIDVGALEAVGVATIGPLQGDVVVDPPNLQNVKRLRIGPVLEDAVSGPIAIRNDAIAALLAERAAGAPASTVYLTLSTGIGAGASVDGQVLTGRDGNAAEVGHLVVDPAGERQCGCGGWGHWEAYCSGAALPGTAAHVQETASVETGLDLEGLTAPDLVAAAGSDPLADRTFERVARYNAIGIAGLVHAYAPTLIVVGGSLGRAASEYVLEPAEARLPSYLAVESPEIRLTNLEEPALEGALHLARQTIESR
jgi:glucokinase